MSPLLLRPSPPSVGPAAPWLQSVSFGPHFSGLLRRLSLYLSYLIDYQMASNEGKAIVVMGVSGAGKSTIGAMLAQVMDGHFVDADDYHPLSSKEKMKAGIPLSDEDRIPWLQTLRDTLRESLVNGGTVILGCSALQKHYRDILRCADPHYIPASASASNYASCAVHFIFLSVEAEVLAARLETRAAQGNHFMPPNLLQSQLDLLEMDDESEGILKVDASLHPHQTLNAIRALLMPSCLPHHLLS